MDTEQIVVDREQARALYLQYKQHRQYSTEIDREIARTYRLIAAGKVVIKALESVKAAGIDERGLPKLALFRADQRNCIVKMWENGSARFAESSWPRSRDKRTIDLPRDFFPRFSSAAGERRGSAIVPIVPLHLRPKNALENYHILWEADWEEVPVDPMLLRRLGKGDLWLVVAAWDLTEVERAALAARIHA